MSALNLSPELRRVRSFWLHEAAYHLQAIRCGTEWLEWHLFSARQAREKARTALRRLKIEAAAR